MSTGRRPTTLAEVLRRIEGAALPATRSRDLASAINRICAMAGVSPSAASAEAVALRQLLAGIRPAAHGLSAKSWANLRSAFTAGLALANVIDALPRGTAKTMGLHDMRRAAAPFLATEAPEQVGLIPGILQQASPEVGERHYNLARSTAASRRYARHVTDLRKRLGRGSRRPRG